ncbi:hypothetical protein K7432_002563 [Basidiobolus ranarum]|uniref:DUF2421 domain-containing protein n=1 Tax=Basidiobolus ranarum TaxID=34480 RepID=A0ABR2X194_9FUNG
MYKVLLKTVKEPVVRIAKVCCRVISHVESRLEPKKLESPSKSNGSSTNESNHRENVNIPLVNKPDIASIIEELELAIKEFDTTEVLCSRTLNEMGLDTKPRDELFMVFTFLFCMREIARKLLKLVRYQEELCKLRTSAKRIWWPSVGFFTLISSPRYDDAVHVPEKDDDPIEQDTYNPAHSDKGHQHFRYRLWLFLMWFKKPEFKFSIKFTLALCLVTIPAFVSSTYDWFLDVHGNWGLVTVCLVMNQTIGSTVSVGIYRIIGTILGGLWGYLCWLASQGNPYIIAVFTYIIGIPCWYFFITRPYTKVPLVSLTTYMIVLFSTYNSVVVDKRGSSTSAGLLAVLRTVNLIIAIIISLLVEMVLWPYVARIELRRHLGITFYNFGVLFSATTSVHLMERKSPAWLEARYEAKKLTSKLQSSITKATTLLALSAKEPRLRDDFQEQTYVDIISRVQNLLDWTATMRSSIVQIDEKVKVKLVYPLNRRRKDVIASLLLQSYVISGAFKSKSPLPPYLPSAKTPRLRLLGKMRRLDAFSNMSRETLTDKIESEFFYTYWYAYAGSLIEVVEEHEELGDLVKKIVGEIKFVANDFNSYSDRTPNVSVDIERMADAAGLSVPRNYS